MFFTQDDYKKIQQWLIKNSVKDTEFNEANIPFNGEETITIVQGNQNKKVFLKDLIAQVFNLGISDFVNITDKYDAPNISLEEAIRLIPSRARKVGQVITFLNEESNWHIYQFRGVLNQWNTLDKWEDLFDWEKLISDSIIPDEEDLTKSLPDKNGNSYLSLKDREYKPKDFSGLGRVILRKNIVEAEDPIYGKVKKNILYQDMINKSNTIYEIRYDFDLNGQEITIPEGCVLDFQGGNLSNGTILGDNTKLLNPKNFIFNNIVIKGLWNNKYVKVDWFVVSDSQEDSVIATKSALALCNEYSTLEFGFGVYYINMLKPKNNMTIVGCGDKTILKLINDSKLYNHPIQINDTYNVTIKNITIDGNYSNQNIDNSKYGIYIVNSRNTTIENVIISECSEGIFLGYSENPTFDVIINNCKIHHCYRNAIAFAMCERVNINNLTLIGYKESSALLDIELHSNGDYVRNITFTNSHFVKGEIGQPIKIISNKKDSVYSNISFYNCNIESDVNIMFFENIQFFNSIIEGVEIIGSKNININNCHCSKNLSSTSLINIYSLDEIISENVNINNCSIKQLNIEKKANAISISGTKNIFINDCFIEGFNRGLYIAYENNNIYINNSQINNNNIGIGVVSNTYKNLFINNSLFENDINYKDLVLEQTFFTVNSQVKDENDFVLLDNITTSRLKLKGVRGEANVLPLEFFENSNTNIPNFKNSKGIVFQLGELHHAAPTPPSGTPKYHGQRYLDNTYNTFYNAISKLDEHGKDTYEIMWAAETVFSGIPPAIIPDFIGQKYYDYTNKVMYIAIDKTTLGWIPYARMNSAGTFNDKPQTPPIGFAYFCTNRQTAEGATNGITIYHKGSNIWVDALGRVVE